MVDVDSVRDPPAVIPYLIKDGLTARVTSGPDNGKPYGDPRTAAMILDVVNKTVSANFETVHFEVCLHQKLNDIVSSTRYLAKVTVALLATDELFEQVARIVKTESDRVLEGSSKGEARIKRFARAAEATVSARLSSSSERPRTDMSDERTNQRAYWGTDSYDEER